MRVFCAMWHVTRNGKRVVSSRSSAKNIRMWFARLDGIWLSTLTFHRQGWVSAATFREGYRLDITPYAFARDDPDPSRLVDVPLRPGTAGVSQQAAKLPGDRWGQIGVETLIRGRMIMRKALFVGALGCALMLGYSPAAEAG